MVLRFLGVWCFLLQDLTDARPNGDRSAQMQSNRSSAAAPSSAIRRDQSSKDLKKLIQELEESDYSSYGSWGNFRTSKIDGSNSRPGHANSIREDLKAGLKSSDSIVENPAIHVEGGDDFQSPHDDLYYREGDTFVADLQNPEFEEPYWQHQNQARSGSIGQSIRFHNPLDNRQWKPISANSEFDEGNSLPSTFSYSFLGGIHLRLSSMFKMTSMVGAVVFLSFLATPQLKTSFATMKKNLIPVFGSILWPMFLLASLYRSKDVDINDVVGQFASSFFVGFPVLYLLEIFLVTVLRLVILNVTEPAVFRLFCPRIPGIFIPWILPQLGYLPSQLTLFLWSIFTCSIVVPLIEEFFKLKMLERALKRLGSHKPQPAANAEFHHDSRRSVRACTIYMLAISLGLKVADNTMRILVNAAPQYRKNNVFALARGLFPVQELCGVLTALSISRRLTMGNEKWNLICLGPAIAFHAFALLRGMKPLFVIMDSHSSWEDLLMENPHTDAEDSLNVMFVVITGIALHVVREFGALVQQENLRRNIM